MSEEQLEAWTSVLAASQCVTNVCLVTREGERKATHALILARGSAFLSSLLQEAGSHGEEIIIMLPDFSLPEVEDCFQTLLLGQEGKQGSLSDTLHISVEEGKDPIGKHEEIKQELKQETGSKRTRCKRDPYEVSKERKKMQNVYNKVIYIDFVLKNHLY